MSIQDRLYWFQRKWSEDHEKGNWEERRALKDDPEGVLAGIHRLRSREPVRAPIPMNLLDQNVNVGRSVEFDSSSGTEFNSILNLEADDKRSRLLTLHTIAGAQAAGFNGAEFLEGRLLWGAGGVQGEITFDWLFGTTITVVASFVRLEVRATGGLPPGVRIRAGAFAGYGGVGSARTTPQLTVPMGLAVPAGSVSVAIPPYAKDVIISRVESAGGVSVPPAFRVAQLPTAFIGTANAIEQYAAGATMERPMPIVPGSTFVSVVNIDVVNLIARATFGLAV